MRRRKKSKNRPKSKGTERRRKQKVDMGTPIAEVTKDTGGVLTRRHAIVAGVLALGGIAVWRASLSSAIEDRTEEDRTESEEVAPVPSSNPEYDEWASKIHLPEGKFMRGSGKLRPLNIPEDKMDAFTKKYEDLLRETKQALAEKGISKEKKEQLVTKFIGSTFREYHVAAGSKRREGELGIGSKEFVMTQLELNDVLLHMGHFMWANLKHDQQKSLLSISTLDVESIDSFQIPEREDVHEVPVVNVHNEHHLFADSDEAIREGRLHGVYNQTSETIIYNQEGGQAQIAESIRSFEQRTQKMGHPFKFPNTDQMVNDGANMARAHELMHYWLAVKGFEAGDRKDAKDRGDVDMGSYKIGADHYRGRYNTYVHELAAVGYGLMHGGQITPAFIIAIAGGEHPTYQLAQQILINELLSIANPVQKNKIIDIHSDGSSEMDLDQLAVFISQMPLERLHKIGERMAKLGTYLAGK